MRLYEFRNLLESKIKIDHILRILNIAKSTLYLWIKKYLNNLTSKNKIERKLRNNKITHKCISYIILSIMKNPNQNIKQLPYLIKKHFSIKISRGYIYQLLKKNNITYKKIQFNKYPHNDNNLDTAKQKLKNEILSVNKNMISIDETSFELGLRPNYGWSKINERCVRKMTNVRKRYSVVMAINTKSILSFKIVAGSFNGESFKNFIVDNVLPLANNDALLMDNARIHKYKGFIKHMTDNNVGNRIIYNIPYCPQYNPIEYVFNTIKMSLKQSCVDTLKGLKKFLNKTINKLNKKGFSKYFKKSFDNLIN